MILVGNLGQDPDMRRMPNGDAVAQITVATSESWKDQAGQKQERTEWHRCVVYRKLAEIVGQYRITSYNVCYTKLLRDAIETLRHVEGH